MTDFFEPAIRGVQHANLRAANRRAVLTTITFSPGISNADVSRRTGLAPQTASAIVSELEAEGLITRGEVLRGRRGQPATPLSLNYEAAYSIGCEISWQHLEVCLITMGSRELARHRRDFALLDPSTIIDEAGAAIAALLAQLDPQQRERAVSVGLAAPSDISRHMQLLDAPQATIDAWESLDIRAEIERVSGLPTTLFNDGNAACWSEMIMRPAPRPENFAYLYVGTFLGSGVICPRCLNEGPTECSANLGAMLLPDGDGKRQLGYLAASTTALRRRLAANGVVVPETNPMEWPWADWEPHLSHWVNDTATALADIIINTTAVTMLHNAVIDGEFPADVKTRLVEATREKLAEAPVISFQRPILLEGRLGTRASSFGAAQLPLFIRLFSHDLTVLAG